MCAPAEFPHFAFFSTYLAVKEIISILEGLPEHTYSNLDYGKQSTPFHPHEKM
jgi:hypothetical protein